MVLADAGILCNIDLDAVLDDHIASGKDITVVMKSGRGQRQEDHCIWA